MIRRVAKSLRDLGGLLGAPLATSSAEELLQGLDTLAAAAVDRLLDDDRVLSEVTMSVVDRFRASWPSHDEVGAMLDQAESEIREVREAVEVARERPDMRDDALMEIGDAMLALARLGLALGAKTPLEPLAMSLCKTTKRLRFFESLIASGGGILNSKRDLWRMAKGLAAVAR